MNGEKLPQSVQFTDDERMAVRQEIAALKGFTVRALLGKKDQQKTNEDFSEATETKATLERVSAVSLIDITSNQKQSNGSFADFGNRSFLL